VRVPDERGEARVYLICEPASHYYSTLTRGAWMPVLIGQRVGDGPADRPALRVRHPPAGLYSPVEGIQKEGVVSNRLSGKVAVVTGASKGIGAEVAKHLAAEGAAVVVNYASSKAGADKVVAEITRQGGRAIAVPADVAKPDDIRRLFACTKEAFGRLDVLVNNAGVYDFAPLEAITPEHFHRQFDLNVLGLILATQEAVKHFGPQGGSVVNIGSVVGKLALPSTTVYSATKAAVDSVTRTLSAELGPQKVRVNAVNPGMVQTEGNASAADGSEFRQAVEAHTPLGRIGQVDDIAPAVAFLASEDAKWVTGETLYIAGGYR
jgi:3-oxoacyl-[acyl-carrier protein] reductase